ncbi:beta-N-acetylhexosaminidase [Parasphaerochaeta coccoides]|uniref:beta-N-acetylhexosaminidase n=1 Tax=Parasphaerochaeta coccoides (strain ATCC BAA-1237 / DSM 17374 / SPN1) TaxID=760011 RepID=F4GI08_PARC1|nr:beta-N-acetylhexosaminidase [Parasphaerochaeta coccoides]AEC02121.1 Beta-N-acetylhexosaminidase [Parasphaerochaeta coccoides DSM 17374]
MNTDKDSRPKGTQVPRISQTLVPRPLAVQDENGEFCFTDDVRIIHEVGFSDQAAFLAKETGISHSHVIPWGNYTAEHGEKTLMVMLRHEDGLPSEGYNLEITPGFIRITASEGKGMFWGIQSLMQLFLIRNDECEDSAVLIPCGTVHDAPAFAWRGFMLDCCRHFFTVSFIKKLIAAASRFKLNVFHWHLTDDQGWRIPITEYPALTEIGSRRTVLAYQDGRTYGGFYTHDEIREVVEYAASHNMDVLPEIETPGHASAILASYPHLGCEGVGSFSVEDRWGIFDNVLNVGNDEVFTMLDCVIRTVASLFPFPYIHIGGDECPRVQWKNDPLCHERIKQQGLKSVDELQSWSTVQVNSIAAHHGKKIIGWDEILDGTDTMGLPSDAVVMSWRGLEGGIKASDAGHKVIMCPTTQGCYLDYKNYDSPEEPGNLGMATVRKSYEFSPTPQGMSENQRHLVLGGQGNLWTEKIPFSRNAEYMLFPRLCALAESFWLGDEKDFEDFASRMDTIYRLLDIMDLRYYQGPWA